MITVASRSSCAHPASPVGSGTLLQVAPTVAALLGIPPPPGATELALFGLALFGLALFGLALFGLALFGLALFGLAE